MKNNIGIRSAVALGVATLLSACGGGGGDGGSLTPTTPVTLTSKADGLRELSLALGSSGVLADFVDLPSPGATIKGGRSVRAKAIEQGDCSNGGTYKEEDGTKDRDFKLLNPQTLGVEVEFEIETETNCKEAYGDANNSYTDIYHGTIEDGYGEHSDGAAYEYEVAGVNGRPYSIKFEERSNGQLVSSGEDTYYGTIEKRYQSQRTETAISGEYTYYEKEDSQTFDVALKLGDGATPLRVTVPASNSWIAISGTYAYTSNIASCKGGKLKVTTTPADEGGLDLADGYPDGGELKIETGSTTAIYTFADNGSANLVINGGTPIPLTAQEVRNAFTNDACAG